MRRNFLCPLIEPSKIKTAEGLRREIGVVGLSANIVNSIVGAGIFVLPAIVAGGLGAASIYAYLVCGFLVACIMLCFAEMGSRVTQSGGPYAYIEEAFGNYAGFLTACIFMFSTFASDAALSNAVADILSTFFPIFGVDWFRAIFFLVMLTALCTINVLGVREGIGFVKFNTLAKLTPLFLLVLIGWKDVLGTNLYWDERPGFKTIAEMSLVLFFAFQGGETGLTVGGEVKNAQRTIPRAIGYSISGILFLYILIQLVAQGVLGAALPDFRDSPLAEVGRVVFGPYGFILITIGAAISVFGSLSGGILSNPRVLFGAALDRVIPIPILAAVHKRFDTPHVAIIFYTVVTYLLAVLGGFKQLAILSSAGILLMYLGVALSVIRIRRKQNTEKAAFKMPFGWLFPMLSAAIIIYFLSALSANEAKGIFGLVAGLSLIYAAILWYRKR